MSGIQLILAVITLLCAVAFHFAGTKPLLNVVDYSALKDPAAFNRYVGKLMLIPAAVAALSALISYSYPALAVPLLFLFPVSVLALVVWIASGSKRFAGNV
ncbi:hypothetical protein [Undibacterium luofuense]|uniref:DUF3784 domain-containing protein n=1 Tax=Undibacterium luofuense TaxID=2828733 RepID=A0A941DQ50_9BURK|nr:hypothetical protein [Undibacterium luofuense]MBR7783990.1 hypothetical protein [Undibacterium luofuense]